MIYNVQPSRVNQEFMKGSSFCRYLLDHFSIEVSTLYVVICDISILAISNK